MKKQFLIVLLSCLLCGCGLNLGKRAALNLGSAELEVFEALTTRLKQNQKAIDSVAATIGRLGADYVEKEHRLAAKISSGKRLEAMEAPWQSGQTPTAKSQRAMALYHLYEIERSEQALLEARMQERIVAAAEIRQAYQRLMAIHQEAVLNLKLIMEHINQPPNSRIALIARQFLQETAELQSVLALDDDPKLRAIAERIARYEARIEQSKNRLNNALDTILQIGSNIK